MAAQAKAAETEAHKITQKLEVTVYQKYGQANHESHSKILRVKRPANSCQGAMGAKKVAKDGYSSWQALAHCLLLTASS